MIYFDNLNEFYNFYWFSLMLLNIFIYVVLLINFFLIFFLFDTNYLKTLNEIKFLSNLPFFHFHIILLFLSFAGIPPFLGFLSKFFVFFFLFSKNFFFLIFFFLFINLFSIYFYLQNLKFIISKKISNKLIYKNNFINLNKSIIFYINFLNFFNVFAILYVEEINIFFIFINSNILI